MTQTLSDGTTTIAPLYVHVSGYSWTSEVPVVEHRIAGGGVAYVLRAGGPRKNQFDLVFDDQATAYAAFENLRVQTVWAYADSEMPESDMNVVVIGRLGISPYLDEPDHWIVSVPVSEVPA